MITPLLAAIMIVSMTALVGAVSLVLAALNPRWLQKIRSWFKDDELKLSIEKAKQRQAEDNPTG